MTGLPRLPEPPFPRAVPTTPADRAGACVDLLPRSRGLPQMAGGSASALSLSRPAQASLALRPAGSLSHLKRPSSRGSSPASYPAKLLVSFRINRQLSGWNLPPLMIRAFEAHCQKRTYAPQQNLSFDHLARAGKQRRMYIKAQRLGSLEIEPAQPQRRPKRGGSWPILSSFGNSQPCVRLVGAFTGPSLLT